MWSLWRRLVAGSISVLLCLVSERALACSVCSCDPAALTVGLDRPSNGSLRVALEDRYLVKESGLGPEFEGERENRLLLRAQYAPVRSFVAQVEVPFFLWRDHLGTDRAVDDTARGLGDVQVSARYELLRAGGFIPRHVLAVVGALKLPTGNSHRFGGDDPHLQLGTGSWDPSVGLWYTFGDNPWTWYGGATFRLSTENSHGFRYGNAAFGTAGVRRALFDSRLLLSLEAQARWAGYDTSSEAMAAMGGMSGSDPNSGGFLGYATAGAAVGISDNLLARLQVQVPVVSRLNGIQSEHPVGFAALSWDFAL